MILVHDGILNESEKANQYIFGDYICWIPKSQILSEGKGRVEIPDWLAKEKELEVYAHA